MEMKRYSKSSTTLIKWCDDMLAEHKRYIHEYGEDMPYILNWKWGN